jgi:hypothetical protein
MDSEIKALKRALQNRQAELQELINQMNSDQLNKSLVYRNLESELTTIMKKLRDPESLQK